MSRVHVPVTSMALALGIALHGTAVAQAHQTHAAPTPVPVAQDHVGHAGHPAMDHANQHRTSPSPGAPITPLPVPTDADRAAAFPVLHRDMPHAPEINSYVEFTRLEAWDAKPGAGQAWEGQAWVGSDLNRFWLHTQGERTGGRTDTADLQVLYGRSVSTWWDVLTGIKHDFNPDGSQTWAAFGVQGLAPYKFDVSATAYIGESGQTSATVEAEYALLLTNRWILQPLVQVTAFGKGDPQRGVGAGFNSLEVGVRALRDRSQVRPVYRRGS